MHILEQHILLGTPRYSDVYTVLIVNGNYTRRYSRIAAINKCGYVPVLSTCTGAFRAIFGLIQTIISLAAAILKPANKNESLEKALVGIVNFGRGLVEMIPLIGNISLCLADKIRLQQFEEKVTWESFVINEDKYQDRITLFGNGACCLQTTLEEMREDSHTIKKKFFHQLSDDDIIEILKFKLGAIRI